MLQVPFASSFMGCVGKDKFSDEMTKACLADGVNANYMIDESTPTGGDQITQLNT
jgi:adenosine kinase